MTDPDAVKNEPEDAPPPPPRRPQHDGPELSQVEADEIYARQLAEHYDNVGAYESRTSARRSNRRAGESSSDEAHEHSFIDDDLPVIRENLRKGFLETQTKVSGWITNLRKKIEENFDETDDGPQTQSPPFRRQGEAGRRSGDYDRYDADPQVLSDDFAGIRLAADGGKSLAPWNLGETFSGGRTRDELGGQGGTNGLTHAVSDSHREPTSSQRGRPA